MKQALLLSNSRLSGESMLEWCSTEIREFLKDSENCLFVPWALSDHEGYARQVGSAFDSFGLGLSSIHESDDPVAAINEASAIFVGGGNTFRLLDRLQRAGVVEVIRNRVASGELRYMGSSAGSNVAAPTIRTTNDMPIVQPASFDAIGIVPFQINPHYTDPDPASSHMGETREERLIQYLEENETPVVGIREGSLIRVEGETYTAGGRFPARIFRRGVDPYDVEPDSELDLEE
ncbi:MAG: dipeptidase PepE [Acidobacteria bacterium]|nr:dipeptidase PepE [Acidobacteriota bacterium]